MERCVRTSTSLLLETPLEKPGRVPGMLRSLLCGTAVYLLDRKFRLVIPKEFRDLRLGQEFYAHALSNRRVILFNERDFEKMIDGRPTDFRDETFSTSWFLEADPNNGRVTLPLFLVKHMDIERYAEIAVSGVGEGVIICDYQHWKSNFLGDFSRDYWT